MEPLLAVRTRPGMYIGGVDGRGVVDMVLDLVANAYDQYLAGRCSAISIEIDADGTITVADDGPGISVHGGGGVPALELLLTRRSDRPTVDDHRPHVHFGLGGIGLFVVNALSAPFELVTVCDGVEARTTYARGEVVEPIAVAATTRPSGTTIRFRPDSAIFKHGRLWRTLLTSELEDLSFLAPGLRLTWRVNGDDLARDGLAARVALVVPCEVGEVAHLTERYETTLGPIDVAVALAWRASEFQTTAEPEIDSFVNLHRTSGDGSHVDGLIDGACKFLGTRKRTAAVKGLVAAISVILADVTFGNPTRNRLETPEARGPVSTATKKALDVWAATHPAMAAALRTRHS